MVANVQHGARAAEETVGISVFFDEGMDEEQIRSLGSQIQSWSEVREARYISAEEAWESFKSEYFEGMEELAEGLFKRIRGKMEFHSYLHVQRMFS